MTSTGAVPQSPQFAYHAFRCSHSLHPYEQTTPWRCPQKPGPPDTAAESASRTHRRTRAHLFLCPTLRRKRTQPARVDFHILRIDRRPTLPPHASSQEKISETDPG